MRRNFFATGVGKISVGDVVVVGDNRGYSEVKVTAVGRKYFTAGRHKFELNCSEGSSSVGDKGFFESRQIYDSPSSRLDLLRRERARYLVDKLSRDYRDTTEPPEQESFRRLIDELTAALECEFNK